MGERPGGARSEILGHLGQLMVGKPSSLLGLGLEKACLALDEHQGGGEGHAQRPPMLLGHSQGRVHLPEPLVQGQVLWEARRGKTPTRRGRGPLSYQWGSSWGVSPLAEVQRCL